jgi:PAS domain S-box-containing protein
VTAGGGAGTPRRRPRLSLQRQFVVLASGAYLIDFLVFCVVAYVEWTLAASIRPSAVAGRDLLAAIAVPVAFGLIDLAIVAGMTVYVIRVLAIPLDRLLDVSVRIAGGERPSVPSTDRADAVGSLARALKGWEDATAARDILLERAPVGIVEVDRSWTVLGANRAAHVMLASSSDGLPGRNFMEFVYPDDLAAAGVASEALLAGDYRRTVFEARLAPAAGTRVWCSAVVAPIASGDRAADTFMIILKDIGERKRQVEAAARIQRQLLPGPLAIAGYELAGACLPASDVAGDLYDWLLTDDGQFLDLAVADVMGRGMAAALVVAMLQTALRAAPQELGPADRVARGDGAVTFDLDDAPVLARLFQARLELRTGVLRYVDAGHGCAAVVRSTGQIVPLSGSSPPLGLGLAQEYVEEALTLQPGDVLLVHSDGLVRGAQYHDQHEVAREVDVTQEVSGILHRLMSRMALPLADDATIVLLRRTAAGISSPRDGGR